MDVLVQEDAAGEAVPSLHVLLQEGQVEKDVCVHAPVQLAHVCAHHLDPPQGRLEVFGLVLQMAVLIARHDELLIPDAEASLTIDH
eukprot:3185226-Pleurochrysis_carterae.AAC.1